MALKIEFVFVPYLGSDSFDTKIVTVEDHVTVEEMRKIGEHDAGDNRILEMISIVDPYEVIFEAEEE